ncbi:MAG: hypothetical protein JXQ67_07630 [Campylobacterales bacterium]|nr:hypothetical protein [Campylobacterales bacterium]
MYQLDRLSDIANNLSAFERDCCITVALKIADSSCKMDAYEQSVFLSLFDALERVESEFFSSNVYEIVMLGRNAPSAAIYAEIKKLRESAMEMITRPKMKAFKASIREKLLT